VDLAPLIQVYDQAIWHHRQAIEAFKQGDVTTALAHNHQALALYQGQADFHALEAQLQTLQGEFGRAITACQKAQRLDPQHPTAVACLQWIAASGFRKRAHDS
jgi:Flp pilus assembly protein TadD